MRHQLIALILTAACCAAPLHAAETDAERSRTLLQQGYIEESKGRYKEAIEKYRDASLADPKASFPISAIANLLLQLSEMVPAERAGPLREQATNAAHAALKNWDGDPGANEVLRKLADGSDAPLHRANAAAVPPFREAETAFAQGQWPLALEKYKAAMAADPQFSGAWVAAGDVYYVQKQWPQAEALFRQATEIERRNGQAWRFLSDALAQQGKPAEAENALYLAIAAQPSQRPNWDKLGALRKALGMPPLQPLGQKFLPVAVPGPDGTATPSVPSEPQMPNGSDIMFWTVKDTLERKLRAEQPGLSPFRLELESWQKTLEGLEQVDSFVLKNPALRAFQKLSHARQLDVGILLLAYRETYRPELEQWLANHPNAVREFIATWNLRP